MPARLRKLVVLRVRVVKLSQSPRSHLLSQLSSEWPFSPANFCSSTLEVLNAIEEGKTTRSDEYSLEVVKDHWAHLYFYLLSRERFFLFGDEEVALRCCTIEFDT
jgi:hypothetical protein